MSVGAATMDEIGSMCYPYSQQCSGCHRKRLQVFMDPKSFQRPLPRLMSVVMPCFNEEENVEPLYQRLRNTFASVPYALEFIFVENGSKDATQARLAAIATQDARVRVVVLSRNFGYQGAIGAGLAHAEGDVVVVMDGDQQDPPELIPQMLEEWYKGHDVVYGIRATREASAFYRWGYKQYYHILRAIADIDIPLDASDFALMDRRIVNILRQMPERDRLWRGLRAYAGFSQTGVPYHRPARVGGVSSFNIGTYIHFARRSLFSYSTKPLAWLFTIAILTVLLALIGCGIYLWLALSQPDVPRGFPTLILAVLFLGGIQLMSIAIIGEYIGRIFEEVKQRPPFIVDHEIRFSSPNDSQRSSDPA